MGHVMKPPSTVDPAAPPSAPASRSVPPGSPAPGPSGADVPTAAGATAPPTLWTRLGAPPRGPLLIGLAASLMMVVGAFGAGGVLIRDPLLTNSVIGFWRSLGVLP